MQLNSFFPFVTWTAGGYGLILLLVYLLQSHLLYFPSKGKFASPSEVGLPYESVKLMTEDGLKLDGWYVQATNARGVLLFFHGNAGNISHRLNHLLIFSRLGLSTFIFDYRGYGESEGKISEAGTYLDAKAAWYYLLQEQGIPPKEIIIYGQSLGGAIASRLAKQTAPGGLIIESGFTSIPDLAAQIYPLIPARWLSRFQYNARDNLRHVYCPVLIIHAKDDEIVPVEHGRDLFDAAKEPKTFLSLKGHHNDGFIVSGDIYTDGIDQFIDSLAEKM